MNPEHLLLVGRCLKPHGIRGEVKVLPETDDPARLLALRHVHVGEEPETSRLFVVTAARLHQTQRGTLVLIRLDGIASPELAAKLHGQGVYADEADLPAPDEDDVYLHDLLGLTVRDAADPATVIGEVVDFLEGTPQRCFIVARPDGSEVLIPDVDALVVGIDLDAGTMTVQLPDGLLDVNTPG